MVVASQATDAGGDHHGIALPFDLLQQDDAGPVTVKLTQVDEDPLAYPLVRLLYRCDQGLVSPIVVDLLQRVGRRHTRSVERSLIELCLDVIDGGLIVVGLQGPQGQKLPDDILLVRQLGVEHRL